jgi:hypothetical protein
MDDDGLEEALDQLNPLEDEEQAMVYQWCTSHPDERLHPIFSTLNGVRLPIGAAVKAKRTGHRSAIPDLFLPVPYYSEASGQQRIGLWIEMKRRKKSYPSAEQVAYIKFLNDAGYTAHVCRGYHAAIRVIKNYFDGEV